MGLGYTPIVEVTGPNADLVNSGLLNWELIDASGRQSDQLTLKVDVTGIEGLPTKDQIIGFKVGFAETGLVDKGEYKITRIKPRLYPRTITIVATAAPFEYTDKTEYRRRKTRTYEATTVGEVVSSLASSHGFTPRIAPDLAAIPISHLDQSDETDMGFLTRLAKRYDAVTKPVGDLYVFARKGQVKTLSGQNLEPVELSLPAGNDPQKDGFINVEMDDGNRSKNSGFKAVYWDSGKVNELEVSIGEAPYKKLRQPYDSETQAREAATAELRKLARTGIKVRLDVPGNPALASEGLLSLDSSFPDGMAGRWSIDRVISRGDRGQGYRCSVEATEPL